MRSHALHEPREEHEEHEEHQGHQGREGQEGHDKHAGHSVEMFRDKFWGSAALTVPTVVWSPMVQQWLAATRDRIMDHLEERIRRIRDSLMEQRRAPPLALTR